MNNFERQYLNNLDFILHNGYDSVDRTGVGTRKYFSVNIRHNLEHGMPILTLRRIAPRIAFEELMWMLRGQTDSNILKDKKIRIWDGNTSREFLDKNGLSHLKTGDIGKGYGYQMRNFNDKVDQIKYVWNNIKNNPSDRRHLVSIWNPSQLKDMALPPCHYSFQFMVTGNRLNLQFNMRSSDYVYGLPYNFAFYSMLLVFFAQSLNYEVGEIVYNAVDVHVYNNQIELAERILKREPKQLPSIKISKKLNSLGDILNLQWEDIEFVGYDPHPDFKDKPPMAK